LLESVSEVRFAWATSAYSRLSLEFNEDAVRMVATSTMEVVFIKKIIAMTEVTL